MDFKTLSLIHLRLKKVVVAMSKILSSVIFRLRITARFMTRPSAVYLIPFTGQKPPNSLPGTYREEKYKTLERINRDGKGKEGGGKIGCWSANGYTRFWKLWLVILSYYLSHLLPIDPQ